MIGISVLVGQSGYLIFSLRADVNKYVLPREVTKEQAEKLKHYLSARQPFGFSIEVVPNDQEASEYASELFNAFRQTDLDINPPNHGGPGPIKGSPPKKTKNY